MPAAFKNAEKFSNFAKSLKISGLELPPWSKRDLCAIWVE
jgi:hypothetical protein